MNTTVAKLIATAAIATFTGLTLTTTGAQADDITVSTAANQPTAIQSATTRLNLYSNNLIRARKPLTFRPATPLTRFATSIARRRPMPSSRPPSREFTIITTSPTGSRPPRRLT